MGYHDKCLNNEPNFQSHNKFSLKKSLIKVILLWLGLIAGSEPEILFWDSFPNNERNCIKFVP